MLFVARSLWTLVALVAWVAPGVCLATPASFSQFAIYGEQSVDIDRHEVIGGPIGSGGDVTVNSSEITGVYSGGDVLVGEPRNYPYPSEAYLEVQWQRSTACTREAQELEWEGVWEDATYLIVRPDGDTTSGYSFPTNREYGHP